MSSDMLDVVTEDKALFSIYFVYYWIRLKNAQLIDYITLVSLALHLVLYMYRHKSNY